MASTPATTGRATTHAQIPAATSTAQRVMRRAHGRAKTLQCTFAEALRQSWAVEKGLAEVGAEAVLAHREALARAVTLPAPPVLPPARRSRVGRAPISARRDLTVQLGHAFARTLRMVDAWVRAGAPTISENERAAVGVIADACIQLLDATEADSDLEPSLCGVIGNSARTFAAIAVDAEDEHSGLEPEEDFEPSLGSRETVGNPMIFRGYVVPEGIERSQLGDQTTWSGGCNDDKESDADCDLEDGGDDEPSLGSLNITPSGFGLDQARWCAGNSDDLEAGDDNGIADRDGDIEQLDRKDRADRGEFKRSVVADTAVCGNLRPVFIGQYYRNNPLTID